MEAYEQLETELAMWIKGDPECMVVCASGTAALQLALAATRMPTHKSVVVPEFCMNAVPRAVTMAGYDVNPVDVSPDDLNLCPYRLEQAIEEDDVGAVIAVATYGRTVNEDVYDLCEKHGLLIIEDLAEAHGLHPYNGGIACWSFYRNKIVHGEEGGAVYFPHTRLADVARSLRSQGFTAEHDFLHTPGGFNARLSNLHAEPISKSLKGFLQEVERRQELVEVYQSEIDEQYRMPLRDANWVYDIRMTNPVACEVVRQLRVAVPSVRMAFKPVSQQPEYYDPAYVYTEAYTASQHVLYLSLGPEVTPDTARDTCKWLRYVLKTL